MKKVFLLLAFAGIVGAASANTLVSMSKATVTVVGDDKKGDDKKKDEKSCSKKGGKSCCKKGEGKATSDAKSTSDAKATPAATPAKK